MSDDAIIRNTVAVGVVLLLALIALLTLWGYSMSVEMYKFMPFINCEYQSQADGRFYYECWQKAVGK